MVSCLLKIEADQFGTWRPYTSGLFLTADKKCSCIIWYFPECIDLKLTVGNRCWPISKSSYTLIWGNICRVWVLSESTYATINEFNRIKWINNKTDNSVRLPSVVDRAMVIQFSLTVKKYVLPDMKQRIIHQLIRSNEMWSRPRYLPHFSFRRPRNKVKIAQLYS